MPAKHLRLAALIAAATATAVHGAEGDNLKIKVFTEPTADYVEQKAQLDAMLSSRDVELYELSCQPLALDSIVIQPRVGTPTTYQYLVFRLRNQITEDTKQLAAKATRYNEILQHVAEQYESAKVENGVTLNVDGEKVLDRAELRARARTVPLAIYAFDENGSRIRLLDEPPGSGPQENFNFRDVGDSASDASLGHVREKIEEVIGRRLHTVDEIRKLPLPPYDPAKINADGEAEGEVFGVVIFDPLSSYGDRFTIEMRGINNKIRVRKPDSQAGQVDDYLKTRVLRRAYVLHYDRPGDEFYRDQDRFTLVRSGWEWLDTFQRVQTRKDAAYAKYFLDNITDDAGERNKSVEEEAWPYYDAERAARPSAGDKLPDLQSALGK